MGRHARRLHELRPVRKANSAYVWWRGRHWPLGPWDVRRGQPSDAAEEKLAALKALWRADPQAGLVREDGERLSEDKSDLLAKAQAALDRLKELKDKPQAV